MLADIILIIIVLLNTLVGYKRGLFNMIGRLAVLLISLLLTLLMLSPLVGWLAERPVLQPLADRLSTPVLQPLQQGADDLGSALDELALPSAIEMLLAEQMPDQNTEFIQAYPAFSAALFRFALMAAFFILIFALISISVHLLTRSLTRVSDKMPLLGFTNRLTGSVIGLAFGMLQVVVLLIVLAFLAPYWPAASELLGTSQVADIIYRSNLLGYLF